MPTNPIEYIWEVAMVRCCETFLRLPRAFKAFYLICLRSWQALPRF
jgi:hypothetical protein